MTEMLWVWTSFTVYWMDISNTKKLALWVTTIHLLSTSWTTRRCPGHLSLSVFVYIFVSLCLSLSLTLPSVLLSLTSASLSASLCLSLCFSLCLSLSSFSFSNSPFCLSISHLCLSLCLPLPLSLSASLCLSLCFSLCLSLSLSLPSLSLSICWSTNKKFPAAEGAAHFLLDINIYVRFKLEK